MARSFLAAALLVLTLCSHFGKISAAICDEDEVIRSLLDCLKGVDSTAIYYYVWSVAQTSASAMCNDIDDKVCCMDNVLDECSGKSYLAYVGNGSNLVAAFRGFCSDTSKTTDALSCDGAVDISTAANLFQATIVPTTSSTSACSAWNALINTANTGAKALYIAACSSTDQTTWWTFFWDTLYDICETNPDDWTDWTKNYNSIDSICPDTCSACTISSDHILYTLLGTILPLMWNV